MSARTWLAILGVVALCAAGAVPVAIAADSCLDCHRKLEDPRLSAPAKDFAHDVHARRGLGCAGCHGGNPDDPEETSMDPERGFKPAPGRSEIVAMCVSCHANAAFMRRFKPRPYIFSLAEYRTSVHGRLEARGDQKVATCTSCHGVHGMLSHTDPESPVHHRNVPETCAKCHNAEYLAGRGVPTNQHENYLRSVHGVALLEKGDASAPACNDCHGNHGAAPPGVKDVANVCGTCHGRVAELFNASSMKAAIEESGQPGCVSCHGDHDIQPAGDEMLAVDEPGVCGDCHEPGSEAEQGTNRIMDGLQGLKASLVHADTLLKRAEILGMETTAGRTALREAEDALLGARALLHSFDTEQVSAALDEGQAFSGRAVSAAESALLDWRNRRLGLGLSLIAILFLIGLLVLKIRAVESKS